MSKEIKVKLEKETVMVHGFNEERFNNFLGRILTIVETLGLSSSQETALKSLVKQEVWALWENPWSVEEKEKNFY